MVSKGEFDVRLELLESRMDARVQRIEDTTGRMAAGQAVALEEYRGAKKWAVGTAIASVLSVCGVIVAVGSMGQAHLGVLTSLVARDLDRIGGEYREVAERVRSSLQRLEASAPRRVEIRIVEPPTARTPPRTPSGRATPRVEE